MKRSNEHINAAKVANISTQLSLLKAESARVASEYRDLLEKHNALLQKHKEVEGEILKRTEESQKALEEAQNIKRHALQLRDDISASAVLINADTEERLASVAEKEQVLKQKELSFEQALTGARKQLKDIKEECLEFEDRIERYKPTMKLLSEEYSEWYQKIKKAQEEHHLLVEENERQQKELLRDLVGLHKEKRKVIHEIDANRLVVEGPLKALDEAQKALDKRKLDIDRYASRIQARLKVLYPGTNIQL